MQSRGRQSSPSTSQIGFANDDAGDHGQHPFANDLGASGHKYWDYPETFDPMGFTPDKVNSRHKYAWFPFGGGAHMCLGLHFAYMHVKILMHHLLTSVRVEIADGYAPEWQPWPIPKPKNGLKVRFVPL